MSNRTPLRFDPPTQVIGHASDSGSHEPHHQDHQALRVRKRSGALSITLNGWGLSYKDTRRQLPNFNERIGVTKSFKLGPYWFFIEHPHEHNE
jgi:hypothetical protein